MDSPVRKMLKRNDYNRHKLLRKIKRRNKAAAEQEAHAAEKALKKKLRVTPPKFEDGKNPIRTDKDINITYVDTPLYNEESGLFKDDNGRIVGDSVVLPGLTVTPALGKYNQLMEDRRRFHYEKPLELIHPEFEAISLGRGLWNDLISTKSFKYLSKSEDEVLFKFFNKNTIRNTSDKEWDDIQLYILKNYGAESKEMLKLADLKYKNSGIPVNEITIDKNGEPLLWAHGTLYGGHSTFNSSVQNATIGGESAAGKVKGNFFARDASDGSYPGGGINAAFNYAGSRGNKPVLEYTYPNTWFEKLQDKFGLFERKYIHPVDRIGTRTVDVKNMHNYEKPIIELMGDLYKKTNLNGILDYPFLDNVVYPTYINPGKTFVLDFKGSPWSKAPIELPNKFKLDYNTATFTPDVTREFRVKASNFKYNINGGLYNSEKDAIQAVKKLAPSFEGPHYINDITTPVSKQRDLAMFGRNYYEIRQGRQSIPTGNDIIDEIRMQKIHYPSTTNGVVQWADSEGYNTILMKNVIDANTGLFENYAIDDLVPISSNLIKLATPSTYDNHGRIIPMSKRFNWSNPDIRYALTPFIVGGAAYKMK